MKIVVIGRHASSIMQPAGSGSRATTSETQVGFALCDSWPALDQCRAYSFFVHDIDMKNVVLLTFLIYPTSFQNSQLVVNGHVLMMVDSPFTTILNPQLCKNMKEPLQRSHLDILLQQVSFCRVIKMSQLAIKVDIPSK